MADRLTDLLKRIDLVLNDWELVKQRRKITPEMMAEGKQILLEEQRKRKGFDADK